MRFSDPAILLSYCFCADTASPIMSLSLSLVPVPNSSLSSLGDTCFLLLSLSRPDRYRGESAHTAGCAQCQRMARRGGRPPLRWPCPGGPRPSARGLASSTTSAGASARGGRHRGPPGFPPSPPPAPGQKAKWPASFGDPPPADPRRMSLVPPGHFPHMAIHVPQKPSAWHCFCTVC